MSDAAIASLSLVENFFPFTHKLCVSCGDSYNSCSAQSSNPQRYVVLTNVRVFHRATNAVVLPKQFVQEQLH